MEHTCNKLLSNQHKSSERTPRHPLLLHIMVYNSSLLDQPAPKFKFLPDVAGTQSKLPPSPRMLDGHAIQKLLLRQKLVRKTNISSVQEVVSQNEGTPI